MVGKICLDSDVLIGILKNDKRVADLLETVDTSYCTTAINVFEIWEGRTHGDQTGEFLGKMAIVHLDESSAKRAADMHREMKTKGDLLDLKDILIGAMCIENGLALATFNKKHFERLRRFGLRMVEI
ncbi:MAG: type II toxin-antitoxin system VapC family toxin [Candidatus Diapherotrites archaeon]|uniref:Type II toxin-antitoxin system VapC family toxin n=1 Tax=Candidatus Iainarchaeum sp. TaxID=3101447 RepID=A0A8T3YL34_9ARCH|nr:type II toxin-antitoxin system VapC family toxin [Candidatus Diapherotrites archaeon]